MAELTKDSIFNIKIIEEIKKTLIKKFDTIAVAESVTGGLLQAAFTQVPDASKFFHGGLTAYNLGQKARHLDIETIYADDCGCVSKKVAEEMAIGISALFKSDYGISVTGYATTMPDKGITELFAYMAISYKEKIISSGKINAKNIPQGFDTQLYYTNTALKRLHNLITKK